MHPIDDYAGTMLLILLVMAVMLLVDGLIRWSSRKVQDEKRRIEREGW